jgi:hypothetical protein
MKMVQMEKLTSQLSMVALFRKGKMMPNVIMMKNMWKFWRILDHKMLIDGKRYKYEISGEIRRKDRKNEYLHSIL